MEATRLGISGERVDRFATAFVESKAEQSTRSLNKRGVRNIHTYAGTDGGFTGIAYERGSAHDPSWVMVSILVEQVDDHTGNVVVFVGGGGRGPFKLEEVSMRRVLQGEESVGQAGRFGTVLEDVREVCESLELRVTTEWESETESSMATKIAHKLFDS
jgi:hypothetical protein